MLLGTDIGNQVFRYFSQLKELYGDDIYLEDFELPQSMLVFNSLEEFEQDISECQKCHLGHTRTNFVFGVGDPKANLVFVGEAPGRDEDLQGEPFVGKAGQLLDRILAAIQYKREEVYICNILKCRPPDNRTPTAEEIETCLPYLETQLEFIKPQLLVALGATAAHSLLSVKIPLGKLRGQIWKWKDIDVIVTYHPAALLRNPRLKPAAWEDFKWIKSRMEYD